MKRRLFYLLPVALFAILAVGLYIGLGLDPRETAFPLKDEAPPSFSLAPLYEGEPGLSDADLRTGKVVVLNFFASWCAPCKVEHPYLMHLATRDDVVLMGIDYKDTPETARAWLRQSGNPFTLIGRDDDGRTGIDWGIAGVPETFILNAEGRVVYRQQGPINQPILEHQLIPIIEGLAP